MIFALSSRYSGVFSSIPIKAGESLTTWGSSVITVWVSNLNRHLNGLLYNVGDSLVDLVTDPPCGCFSLFLSLTYC